MTAIRTIRSTFLCAAMLAGGTGPLMAEAPAAPVAPVEIADLDLTHERDRRVLDRRIAAAVDEVCSAGRTQSLPMTPAMRTCRKAASERAETQFALLRTQSQVAAR